MQICVHAEIFSHQAKALNYRAQVIISETLLLGIGDGFAQSGILQTLFRSKAHEETVYVEALVLLWTLSEVTTARKDTFD